MYLVSSSRFSHPISRRALERHEVAALDAHLQRHSQHHGVTETTRIFDRQAEAKRTGAALPGEMAGEVAAARRELAGLFREQLYAAPQRAPPPALARGRGSGRAERDAARLARDEDEQLRRALAASLHDQRPTRRGPSGGASSGTACSTAAGAARAAQWEAAVRAAGGAVGSATGGASGGAAARAAARALNGAAAFRREGGLTMVDDDLLPSHSSAAGCEHLALAPQPHSHPCPRPRFCPGPGPGPDPGHSSGPGPGFSSSLSTRPRPSPSPSPSPSPGGQARA